MGGGYWLPLFLSPLDANSDRFFYALANSIAEFLKGVQSKPRWDGREEGRKRRRKKEYMSAYAPSSSTSAFRRCRGRDGGGGGGGGGGSVLTPSELFISISSFLTFLNVLLFAIHFDFRANGKSKHPSTSCCHCTYHARGVGRRRWSAKAWRISPPHYQSVVAKRGIANRARAKQKDASHGVKGGAHGWVGGKRRRRRLTQTYRGGKGSNGDDS